MKRTKIFLVLGIVLATTLGTIICVYATNNTPKSEENPLAVSAPIPVQYTSSAQVNDKKVKRTCLFFMPSVLLKIHSLQFFFSFLKELS